MLEKNDDLFPLDRLPSDLLSCFAKPLAQMDEPQAIKSARTVFSIFRTDDFRKERILYRLAQYGREANIKQIVSLLAIRPDLEVEVLFTLAGLGALDEMKSILIVHPEYLTLKRPIRDISGAVFENTSILQHAIWSNDLLYMPNMILSCLPKDAEGQFIKERLLEQYNDHMENGLTYCLNGVWHYNEIHFNLNPLIAATVDTIEKHDEFLQTEPNGKWFCYVGPHQNHLPAFIRYLYRISVMDIVKKKQEGQPLSTISLNRSLEVEIDCKTQQWCENLPGLGVDFGISPSCSLMSGKITLLAWKEAHFMTNSMSYLYIKFQIDIFKSIESVIPSALSELKEVLTTPIERDSLLSITNL